MLIIEQTFAWVNSLWINILQRKMPANSVWPGYAAALTDEIDKELGQRVKISLAVRRGCAARITQYPVLRQRSEPLFEDDSGRSHLVTRITRLGTVHFDQIGSHREHQRGLVLPRVSTRLLGCYSMLTPNPKDIVHQDIEVGERNQVDARQLATQRLDSLRERAEIAPVRRNKRQVLEPVMRETPADICRNAPKSVGRERETTGKREMMLGAADADSGREQGITQGTRHSMS